MAIDRYHVFENPLLHGWRKVDDEIEIHWLNEKPAPDAILEFVTCGCKKTNCSNNQCSCRAVDLPCTDLCRCVDCKNENRELDLDESDEDESDSEIDDDEEIEFDNFFFDITDSETEDED